VSIRNTGFSCSYGFYLRAGKYYPSLEPIQYLVFELCFFIPYKGFNIFFFFFRSQS
jgi:hypothetical protein